MKETPVPIHNDTTRLTCDRRHASWALVLMLLDGCGFRPRGSQSLAFSSIAIAPFPGGPVAQTLRRSLGDGVRVLDSDGSKAPPAQVTLHLLSEQRDKVVVGVNASGQVREFQLRLRVKFQLVTSTGQALITDGDIAQQRDISFNESAALAKDAEEALLYRDMQSDIVQQIIRRLATVRSVP